MGVNSKSVYSLIKTIRSAADQINSPTFSDSVELVPWTRDSLKQIYEILTGRYLDWYTVRRPVSMRANVVEYTLPSDFRYMSAVYVTYQNAGAGQPYYELLKQYSKDDFGRSNTFNTYRQWPISYRIQNNKMMMQPAPTQDYVNSIEIQYVPQWTGPLLDWSPIDLNLPNGWDEWVKLDVMQKMKIKMNMDTSDITRMKTEIEARVIAGASQRLSEPPMMRDEYGYPQWNWYNGTPGGSQTWHG